MVVNVAAQWMCGFSKVYEHADAAPIMTHSIPPKMLLRSIDVEASWLGNENIVHIDHSAESATQNLMELARSNVQADRVIRCLANHGYNTYKSKDGVTSLIHQAHIKRLWHRVVQGELNVHNDVIYQVSKPEKLKPSRMLVIFSSIADEIYTPSLSRLFFPNFLSIPKYVPADTLVLRIADIGGVVGAFYTNTNYLRNNEASISEVIWNVIREYEISREFVVLYGTSKGGSGALLHGLLTGLSFVSVDPIVSDVHYIERYRDSHFTVGIFPETKQERFARLMRSMPPTPEANRAIIYSSRSPQYGFISDIVRDTEAGQQISFLDSQHPDITDHPHVGAKTVNAQVMLMNMGLYGIRLDDQKHRSII